MRAAFAMGHKCSAPFEDAGGKATGVVRASLGACSSAADVSRLVEWLREAYTDRRVEEGARSVAWLKGRGGMNGKVDGPVDEDDEENEKAVKRVLQTQVVVSAAGPQSAVPVVRFEDESLEVVERPWAKKNGMAKKKLDDEMPAMRGHVKPGPWEHGRLDMSRTVVTVTQLRDQ